MAEFIVMPKLGFDMREGVLNQWLKQIGDPVSRGEVVAEIESDKATLDLESQVDGVLLHLIEKDGAIVPIGANMAIVGQDGEDISSMLASLGDDEQDDSPEPAMTPAASPAPAQATAASPPTLSAEFPNGVKATPVARRIAADHNVDLSAVPGSGPDGRIRKADVESFIS